MVVAGLVIAEGAQRWEQVLRLAPRGCSHAGPVACGASCHMHAGVLRARQVHNVFLEQHMIQFSRAVRIVSGFNQPCKSPLSTTTTPDLL